MRLLTIIAIVLAGSLYASEPQAHAYPLWDGNESVADYAKRVYLPETKSLDLGNHVTLDLVRHGNFHSSTRCDLPETSAFIFRKYPLSGGV
jgi:hypothetical protein